MHDEIVRESLKIVLMMMVMMMVTMMINHLILCLGYKNKRVQQEVMASKNLRGLEIVLSACTYIHVVTMSTYMYILN